QASALDLVARVVEQGKARGYFKGRGGTQPGPQRDFAVDQEVRSSQVMSSLLEYPRNTQGIVTPFSRRGGHVMVEINLDGIGKILRMNHKIVVVARHNGNPA